MVDVHISNVIFTAVMPGNNVHVQVNCIWLLPRVIQRTLDHVLNRLEQITLLEFVFNVHHSNIISLELFMVSCNVQVLDHHQSKVIALFTDLPAKDNVLDHDNQLNIISPE